MNMRTQADYDRIKAKIDEVHRGLDELDVLYERIKSRFNS